MRQVLGVVLVLASCSVAVAQEDRRDSGGRGLITFEGPAGLFINPTSGTLPRGQFTPQYCVALFEQEDVVVAWHQAMIAYGVTDWLEVGAIGVIEHFDSDHSLAAGGPLLRIRLLEDEGWQPEVGLGGVLREGADVLTRRTVFAAASKRFPIDELGILRAVRLHTGIRRYWQDADVNAANGTVAFLGGELELPRGLFLVAEISTRSETLRHTPFAFGVQVRRPDGFAFTLAVLQTGNQDGLGAYVGIGINFQ
ncbi:MAG TPA: hypothetical protein VGW35_08975 [Methylomirabilota bacterium]|nr:hypothetical protein [Methylomirabilota bacterium]